MKKLLILSALLVSFVPTTHAQIFKKVKKPVEGAYGYLTKIPDSTTIARNDGTLFFFFYDLEKKVLFITERNELYEIFVSHQKKNNTNRVYMDGPIIDPFTLFDKDELEKKAKRVGVQLNGFSVCKLMNYELQTELDPIKK